MRLYFLLFCLLTSLSAAAQRPPARVSKRSAQKTAAPAQRLAINPKRLSDYDPYGFSIHLMPLSFITGFSRLRVGVQYRYKRVSLLVDLETGGDWSRRLLGSLTQQDYSFRGIRPEIRYFPIPREHELYVGLEVPYNYLSRRVDGRFTRTDGARVVVENARQQRARVSTIVKLGGQFIIGRSFMLDLYCGLGAARRNTVYSDADSARLAQDEFFEELGLFNSGLNVEGKVWVMDLAAGFRVGYWFGR